MTPSIASSPPIINSPPPPLKKHPYSTPFLNLSSDCIHVILHYHIFYLQHKNESDNREDDTNRPYNIKQHGMQDSNWNFLQKFAHCCNFHGHDGLLDFLSSCRDWTDKPSFFYLNLTDPTCESLIGTGAVQYLRGVSQLHLNGFDRFGSSSQRLDPANLNTLLKNTRGVKKLSLHVTCDDEVGPFTREHLEHLRGVEEVFFDLCNFASLPHDAFENLRGIKSATFNFCSFRQSNQLLCHLRGIRELQFINCDNAEVSSQDFKDIRGVKTFVCKAEHNSRMDFSLEDKHLKNLRGIHHLEVCESDDRIPPPSLSNDGFKNLRGAKKVILDFTGVQNITDAAFANLRGVEELRLQDMPHLTSAVFDNLRGIKKLTIENCPKLEFSPETLYNLRGSIKELTWLVNPIHQRSILCTATVQNLYGLERLQLNNVSFIRSKAFRYLHSLKHLSLHCPNVNRTTWKVVNFLNLSKLKGLHLSNMNMQELASFSALLSVLPDLKVISVRCAISSDAVTDLRSKFGVKILDRYRAQFTLSKVDGKWVGIAGI